MKHTGGSSNIQILDGLFTSFDLQSQSVISTPGVLTNYVNSGSNIIFLPKGSVFGMWVKFDPNNDAWRFNSLSTTDDTSSVGNVITNVEYHHDESPPRIEYSFFQQGGVGVGNNTVSFSWSSVSPAGYSSGTILDFLQDGWNHFAIVQGNRGSGTYDATLFINGINMVEKNASGSGTVGNSPCLGPRWNFFSDSGNACFQQMVVYDTDNSDNELTDFDVNDIVNTQTQNSATFVDLGRSGTAGAIRTLPAPSVYARFKHPFTDIGIPNNATIVLPTVSTNYDCNDIRRTTPAKRTILDFTQSRSIGSTDNGKLFHEVITCVLDDLNIVAGEVGDDVGHHAIETSGVYKVTDVDSTARGLDTNSTNTAYVPIKSGTYEIEVTFVDNDHSSGPYIIGTTNAYAHNMTLHFGHAVTISGSSHIVNESTVKSVSINLSKAAQTTGATPDNATVNFITVLGNAEEPAYTDTINSPTFPLILGNASLGEDGLIPVSYIGTSDEESFKRNSGLLLVWHVAGGSGSGHGLGRTRITLRNT